MSELVSTFRRSGWHSLVPPFWSLLLLAGITGGILGIGGFTFMYAQGYSYLSDDPAACANCHVMREVYDGWNHGSHKGVATCNECHTPQNFIGHWVIKGLDGFKHSYAFTSGDFHEPIRITDLDKAIAQQNCLRCHGEMTAQMNHQNTSDPTDCLRCHVGEGHGK